MRTNEQQRQNTTDATTPGMTTIITGHNIMPLNPTYRNRETLVDSLTVHLPGLLQAVRCYTDASIAPDLLSLPPRAASIGLFIINTQVNPTQTIYIKAKMTRATSVLMAEAAAIALAAIVTDWQHLQHINFLSDNQYLVHFLNAEDQANLQAEGSNTLLKCSLITQGKEIEEFTRSKIPEPYS
jgi:hypothetical protein